MCHTRDAVVPRDAHGDEGLHVAHDGQAKELVGQPETLRRRTTAHQMERSQPSVVAAEATGRPARHLPP